MHEMRVQFALSRRFHKKDDDDNDNNECDVCSLVHICIVCLYMNVQCASNLLKALAIKQLILMFARIHRSRMYYYWNSTLLLSPCFYSRCYSLYSNYFHLLCKRIEAMLFTLHAWFLQWWMVWCLYSGDYVWSIHDTWYEKQARKREREVEKMDRGLF